MSNSGRKKDPIWSLFLEERKEGGRTIRAKRLKCNMTAVGLVSRLKKHIEKCGSHESVETVGTDEDIPGNPSFSSENDLPIIGLENPRKRKIHTDSPSSSRSNSNISTANNSLSSFLCERNESEASMDKYVIRTNSVQKHKIDEQIARYFYATNTAFLTVEHKEFKNLHLLRPGYTPPSRYEIGNKLLDQVYESMQGSIKEKVLNKNVCLSIDGWSNVHNDPIIAICISEIENEKIHLIESVDTSGESHTAKYLLHLLKKSISKCVNEYKCFVSSIVSDNAANMVKMRDDIFKELNKKDIITYGYSAHILNLLAHDLEKYSEFSDIAYKIKNVCKYFRNVHFARAKCSEAGGTSLVLPQDIRWNTLADCLESYWLNWPILYNVCSTGSVALDSGIIVIVNNVELKMNAQKFLKKLKFISIALDKIQKNSCTIGEATEIWMDLKKSFEIEHINGECSAIEFKSVIERSEMALNPSHLLANLLDHRFQGCKLNNSELDAAMEYVSLYHADALPDIISYRAKHSPFRPYLFSENVTINVKPLVWWKSIPYLNEVTNKLVEQLHTAVVSSANIQRLFSSYGMIHSKLRNRLGNEKAAKLVSIFKELNM